jgi:Thioredoxin
MLRHDWGSLQMQSGRLRKIVGYIVTVVIIAQYMSADTRTTDSTTLRKQFLRWYSAQPRERQPELIGDGGVRIVIFADYPCPQCSSLVPMYRATVNRYRTGRQRVELIVKDFPIDTKCNSAVSETRHPNACDAAIAMRVAARALDEPGVVSLSDRLYAARFALTVMRIQKEMSDLGLLNLFNSQYASGLASLTQDISLGRALKITSTPTVFINGRRITISNQEGLDTVIDYELTHMATPTSTN